MLLENENKKYTQCRLSEEELEELLEKLKSNEISMKEATSLAGVCEKQINNYLKQGISLERGHGSVKPYPDETVYKIMELLSRNYNQTEIRRELVINKSTLSNQCKVLTFVSNKCFVEDICFGGYNIFLQILKGKTPILYIKFTINTSFLIGGITNKQIVKSLDKNVDYDIKYEYGETVRNIIMKKASEDYFKYIPIKPTMRLNEIEQIEKYKEFYKRILNEIDDHKIYSSLENIILPLDILRGKGNKLGGNNSTIILLLLPIIYLLDEMEKNDLYSFLQHILIIVMLIFVVLYIIKYIFK